MSLREFDEHNTEDFLDLARKGRIEFAETVVIGGIERDDGFYECEIDAADYKEVLESAQACPVVVIKIYNQNDEEVN